MIPKDLLAKVRRIEISTSRLVTDLFAGQYHSVFKGQGIEFDEVREYNFGDDVRQIDWNVTARTGRPHIKKYIEERELTVMLMIDVSASEFFGTRYRLKSQVAAEIAALLGLSAIRNNDKVGLLAFSDRVERFIPPRKGRRHVLRVIREALYCEPRGRGTDIAAALHYFRNITKRRTICFCVSDFWGSGAWTAAGDIRPEFQRQLAVTNLRHDLIAVSLHDPAEAVLAGEGLVFLRDAETGEGRLVDAGDRRQRGQLRAMFERRRSALRECFRSAGMDHIFIQSDADYAEAFIRFFKKRRKQAGR
jgi:uncharacterized protein (DUF58 family)